jgi:HEAT repeat protein
MDSPSTIHQAMGDTFSCDAMDVLLLLLSDPDSRCSELAIRTLAAIFQAESWGKTPDFLSHQLHGKSSHFLKMMFPARHI